MLFRSNQTTLGKTEQELIARVQEVIPQLIEYERKAREFLLSDDREELNDLVSRAYGMLKTAKKISSEETMHYLSKIRLGVHLGLIEGMKTPMLNQLFIHTQPAHLQKIRGRKLSGSDRNTERANYLHQFLN